MVLMDARASKAMPSNIKVPPVNSWRLYSAATRVTQIAETESC
jgi:hypothetical protein